jgi:teichuronic acid biosynthesis glycosyltransferase TuaH
VEELRLAIDALVISLWPESWDDLVRTGLARPPGRLVQSLVASADVASLVVANPPRSIAISATKRALGLRGSSLPPLSNGRSALAEPLVLRRTRPKGPTSVGRRERQLDRTVARELARLGTELPPLVTFSPLVAGYCRLGWASKAIYYARDDWAVHPSQRRWWPAHEEAYRRIRRRGMPVVAVSGSVLERLQPEGPAMVLPNGLDEREWLDPAPAPPWVDRLPRPRLVYVGTLDTRLDLEALEAVRRRFTDGALILAGPRSPGNDLEALAGHSNVHVVHLEDRASVVGLVASADVCLLPHRRTPLTEAMNPLKLYEYLAAGRPTVATDLEGSQGIHPRIRLCPEGADFVDAVAAALDEGPMDEASRLEFIEANRWSRRHQRLLAMMEAIEPGSV